ncbi:hypothetical protein CROQUDRAFT_670176 [Cronartium quercuum f. sp. fusiforme G11]|uniref:Rho-GAP domain-containing protein n=1 Tax=Cronartium quercuum f. sp. fusiforme G11 TaxID=708437 RepID=A0A9P6NM24_9BASI|nr:hypothetical protein CROQUDRAFT_670176 [Cronartium quercuum f. sp. fusiforme G11]
MSNSQPLGNSSSKFLPARSIFRSLAKSSRNSSSSPRNDITSLAQADPPRQSSTSSYSLELSRLELNGPHDFVEYPSEPDTELEVIDVETSLVAHKSSLITYLTSRSRSHSNFDRSQAIKLNPSENFTSCNRPRASFETSSRPRLRPTQTFADTTRFECRPSLGNRSKSSLESSIGSESSEVGINQLAIHRNHQVAQLATEDAEPSKPLSIRAAPQPQAFSERPRPISHIRFSHLRPKGSENDLCPAGSRGRRFATCETLQTSSNVLVEVGQQVPGEEQTINSTDAPLSQFGSAPRNSSSERFQNSLDDETVFSGPNMSFKASTTTDEVSSPSGRSLNLPIRLESKDDLLGILERLMGPDILRTSNLARLRKSLDDDLSSDQAVSNLVMKADLSDDSNSPHNGPPSSDSLWLHRKPASAGPTLLTRLGWRGGKATSANTAKPESNEVRTDALPVNVYPHMPSRTQPAFQLPFSDTRSLCRVSFGGMKHYLPIVAVRAIQEIGRRGMRTPGLLATTGDPDRLEYLINNIYNSSPGYGYDFDLAQESIQTLSDLLFCFLRTLPEPLLGEDMFELLWSGCVNPAIGSTPVPLESAEAVSSSVLVAQCVLRLMPPRHFSLIICLFSFMAKTLRFSDNGLTAPALAGVFGPTLFSARSSRGGSQVGVEHASPVRHKTVKVVVWMLENWKSISTGVFVELFQLKLPPLSANHRPFEGFQSRRNGLREFPIELRTLFPAPVVRRRRSSFEPPQSLPTWTSSPDHAHTGRRKLGRTKSFVARSLSPISQALVLPEPLPMSISPPLAQVSKPRVLRDQASGVVDLELVPTPLAESDAQNDKMAGSSETTWAQVACTQTPRLTRCRSSRVLSSRPSYRTAHLRSSSNELTLPHLAKPTLKTMREILAGRQAAAAIQLETTQPIGSQLTYDPTPGELTDADELTGTNELTHDRASAAFVYATWLSIEVKGGKRRETKEEGFI